MVEYSEENKRRVLNRLAKASGHLEAVRRMIDDGKECTDVLIQLTAVRSALAKTEKIILKDYLDGCIREAALSGDEEALERIHEAIDKYK